LKVQKNGGTWKYEYNGNGMMSKVIKPDNTEVTFKYDSLGRRIEKCSNEKIIRFVWDGNTILHEYFSQNDSDKFEHPIESSSQPDSEIADNLVTWVFNDDGFIPTAKITSEGNYSNVSDYLGTPVKAFDEQGKKVWSAELDIYGRVIEFTGEKDFIPFRYQRQYADQEIGLYYNRFRYYSPVEGIYTQIDPIGLPGGNPTLYAYVHNPNWWVDVLGLSRRSNRATRQHMDDVRDRFIADNPGAIHVAGGRVQSMNLNLAETYLPPNAQLASTRDGGSYTDMTFDVNGQTVYIQTVDKGSVHGMSQREWDNANRILRQDPNAVVVTVGKGTPLNPGDLDIVGNNMKPGNICRY